MELIDIDEASSKLKDRGVVLSLDGYRDTLRPIISHRPLYLVEASVYAGEAPPRKFLEAFLRCVLGEWHDCWLWKRLPEWRPGDTDSLVDGLGDFLVRDVIPAGSEGVVHLSRTEMELLYRLVVAKFLCGTCCNDDLFVVPDSATPSFITFQHNGVIRLSHTDVSAARRTQETLQKVGLDAALWQRIGEQ